jgi:hypothetical protein
MITHINLQVGAAATAYGVTSDDVGIVAGALEGLFNTNCATPKKLTPSVNSAA